MIPKGKIKLLEDREASDTRVLVCAKIVLNRMVPVDKAVAYDEIIMTSAKHAAATGLWRDVYGELRDKLVRLKYECVANISPSRSDEVRKGFDELFVMIADPTREELGL